MIIITLSQVKFPLMETLFINMSQTNTNQYVIYKYPIVLNKMVIIIVYNAVMDMVLIL